MTIRYRKIKESPSSHNPIEKVINQLRQPWMSETTRQANFGQVARLIMQTSMKYPRGEMSSEQMILEVCRLIGTLTS